MLMSSILYDSSDGFNRLQILTRAVSSHSVFRMTERLRWLGFFLLLVLDPAGGATLTGLYEAEVSISNRDSAHETQAMEEALRAVLLKLSSDRNAATRTEIARVLEEVRDYVQHLQYREVVAGPVPGLKLWVQFDRK